MRNEEMYKAAIGKRKQLEQEISTSDATPGQKRDMQHTLSKLWSFISEVVDDNARAAQKADISMDSRHI